MKIEVTQEDIDGADLGSIQKCAVARALRRQGFPRAEVGVSYWWPYDTSTHGVDLPQAAAAFIARASYKEYLRPFSFEVDDG